MFCLKQPTDSAWAAEAVREIDAILVDHAHCEMKAASNALSLAARHPDDIEIVRGLTDLAREEIEHFQRVLYKTVLRCIHRVCFARGRNAPGQAVESGFF